MVIVQHKKTGEIIKYKDLMMSPAGKTFKIKTELYHTILKTTKIKSKNPFSLSITGYCYPKNGIQYEKLILDRKNWMLIDEVHEKKYFEKNVCREFSYIEIKKTSNNEKICLSSEKESREWIKNYIKNIKDNVIEELQNLKVTKITKISTYKTEKLSLFPVFELFPTFKFKDIVIDKNLNKTIKFYKKYV